MHFRCPGRVLDIAQILNVLLGILATVEFLGELLLVLRDVVAVHFSDQGVLRLAAEKRFRHGAIQTCAVHWQMIPEKSANRIVNTLVTSTVFERVQRANRQARRTLSPSLF